jgi:uncharacterized membrane protein
MNDKRLRQIMIVLATSGLLVSIYMTVYKFTKIEAMCIGSGGCSTVNGSRYSEINGIPVAVLGILGYATILALLFLESRPGFFQDNGTMLQFGISLLGFLFTLYLIYVETALIKAYCPFCLTSQAVMTIIFILSVIRLARQP